MSTTVRCSAAAMTGVATTVGAAVICGAAGASPAGSSAAGVAPDVVAVAVLATGTGLLTSSGNSFGAMAAQPQRTATDTRIAMKMRFSIFRGRGPNLQD